MSATLLAILNLVLIAVSVVGFLTCHRELRIIRRGMGALDEGQGRRAATLVSGLQALREPLEAIRAGVEELSPNRRDTVDQRRRFHAASVPALHALVPEPTGLRLDLPSMADEVRDSEVETQVMKPRASAESAGVATMRSTIASASNASTPMLSAGLSRARGRHAPALTPPPSKRTVVGLPPPANAIAQDTHRPPPESGSTTVSRRTGARVSMPVPSSGTPPQTGFRTLCRLCEGIGTVRTRSGGLEDCRGCNGAGYIDPTGGAGDEDEEREARLPG
ncbi:Hypothetical protein A7982_10990 [Minicystis rosea]|nr:Hypothetical protein A7982_10990 [Minicystis rosea]